jgi:hypothetical protein
MKKYFVIYHSIKKIECIIFCDGFGPTFYSFDK